MGEHVKKCCAVLIFEPETEHVAADMILKQSQMSQSAQRARADHAAKKEQHTAAETIVSTPRHVTAKTLNHLEVIAEVITVQTREQLTSNASQTANHQQQQMSHALQGKGQTTDQTRQNLDYHGKVLQNLAAGAGTLIVAALGVVDFLLDEVWAEVEASLMAQAFKGITKVENGDQMVPMAV